MKIHSTTDPILYDDAIMFCDTMLQRKQTVAACLLNVLRGVVGAIIFSSFFFANFISSDSVTDVGSRDTI